MREFSWFSIKSYTLRAVSQSPKLSPGSLPTVLDQLRGRGVCPIKSYPNEVVEVDADGLACTCTKTCSDATICQSEEIRAMKGAGFLQDDTVTVEEKIISYKVLMRMRCGE